MYKKIIAVITVLAVALFAVPTFAVFAASDFTVKKDSAGKSYISGYKGGGGEAVLPGNADYIGSGAFENNTKITSVIIPESCGSIGKKAFANCVNLRSVTFMGDVSQIGDEAFMNCVSLEEVIFDKMDAAVGNIGEKAFANCFGLETVNLPLNTKKIGEFAFGNCISLGSLTIPKNTSLIEKNAVGYMYDEKTERYFPADGETAAYISYYELYSGKLMEWYAPNTGKIVSLNVVKDSEGEEYAKENEMHYAYYKSVDVPKVTTEAELDSIVLKWNRIDGADAYKVSILNGNDFEEYKITTAKMCTVKGLESGKKYTFKVTVLSKIKANKYSELISSGQISAVTKAPVKEKSEDKGLPDAPEVTAEADSDNVSLSWKKVDNADAYRVEMYNSQTGRFEKYKVVYGKSCTVTGLQSGTEYRFKVVSLYSVKNKYADGGTSGEVAISTADIVKSR